MRKLFILFLIAIFHSVYAIDINKRIASALENINNGYVQYGCDELKRAAAVNDLAAQFYVAVCYENGIGMEKDLTQSFRMYRKAAERGLPDAMYHIASFYREGIVVTKNNDREHEWLQRFSQKGGALTLPDIIAIYNEGIKHPENYALNPNEDGGVNLMAHNDANIKQQKQTINNITIVQQTPLQNENVQPEPTIDNNRAKVDIDIPICQKENQNVFAIIIANENYQDVTKVPNALNDGTIFAEYCEKTLGIPHNNIKFVSDATLNNIKRELNWLSQVMDVYQGEASIIFYYAGHGIPDESNGSAYLLPVDGIGTDVSTGYSLDRLYADLGSKPAKSVVILLDACFSGAKRDGGMLASARGVAIKAKQNTPKGNMVVLAAAQGDETAFPYKEKGHGMFTYYLLKKLQDSNGEATLGEIADYVIENVRKQSIVTNGKMQTPTLIPSLQSSDWRNWKLK